MRASKIFSDLPAAPRDAAGRLLAELRLSEQTINLSSLVLRFQDCDLLEVDIEGDGYCLPAGMLSDKTLVVIPAKGQGEERRRFTLAHELGHLACHYHRDKDAIRDEERWCDTFASELLMPRARVDAFASSVTNLSDWLRFRDRFKVSRAAAARRLWDHCGVMLLYGRVKAKNGDLRYDALREELIALAAETATQGDTIVKLGDGREGLIRRHANGGHIAVAQA